MIKEKNKKLQNCSEKRVQTINNQKDQIKQFEEKLKNKAKNSLILFTLFDTKIIDVGEQLLVNHYKDDHIKIEEKISCKQTNLTLTNFTLQ